MIIIAPYTGDPTWDYFNAFFMSALTYLTAPWAIGAVYNVAKGKLNPSQAFVAICLWMLSASWSYDLYLVLRDGDYPITWFSNIFASSVLYISAGLFWNLDWAQGRGITFAFMENNWPYSISDGSFSNIVWYALPFMALASFLILYFFWFKAGIWGYWLTFSSNLSVQLTARATRLLAFSKVIGSLVSMKGFFPGCHRPLCYRA